jgi:hypothetical protein
MKGLIMNDITKNALKVAGAVLLAYGVLTTRVVGIHPTGSPPQYIIGTNFWSFYPFDSAAAYCERNRPNNQRLAPEDCVEWVSDGVAAKWLIVTISSYDPPATVF